MLVSGSSGLAARTRWASRIFMGCEFLLWIGFTVHAVSLGLRR